MIVNAGPIVKFPGNMPCRVVLRAIKLGADGKPGEFVVHYEAFEADGKSGYSSGSYFPVRHYDSVEGALEAATWAFDERCDNFYAGAKWEHYSHPDVAKLVEALPV